MEDELVIERLIVRQLLSHTVITVAVEIENVDEEDCPPCRFGSSPPGPCRCGYGAEDRARVREDINIDIADLRVCL